MDEILNPARQLIGLAFEPGDLVQLQVIWPRERGPVPTDLPDNISRNGSGSRYATTDTALQTYGGFLKLANTMGLGVYICVNPVLKSAMAKGPFSKAASSDIAIGRNLVLDIDQGKASLEAHRRVGMPEPTVLVESSSGNFQAWYRLSDPVPPEELSDLMKRLVRIDGIGDRAATDACRIFRLPGFRHTKRDPGFWTRIVSVGDSVAIEALVRIADEHVPKQAEIKPARDSSRRSPIAADSVSPEFGYELPEELARIEPYEYLVEADQSRVDYAKAIEFLNRGFLGPEIIASIGAAVSASARYKPGDYAARTYTKAMAEMVGKYGDRMSEQGRLQGRIEWIKKQLPAPEPKYEGVISKWLMFGRLLLEISDDEADKLLRQLRSAG